MLAKDERRGWTWLPIGEVHPYPNNPREISQRAIEKIADSLTTYGWQNSILLDANRVIIAGHGRLLAAKHLGETEVPTSEAFDLTPAQVQGLRITDNRVAEESDWNGDRLQVEIESLRLQQFDIGPLGFDDDELSKLLERSKILSNADVDEAPPLPAEAITKLGDRIVLGRHVLICGSSTDESVWKRLVADQQPNAMWTDPPYGVSYVGKTKDALTIENDSLPPAELLPFLRKALGLAHKHMKPGGAVYVAAPAGPLFYEFATVLRELDCWRHTLVWLKDAFVMGRSDYHYRHEAIFYGWKAGGPHTWLGGRKQDSILEVPRPRASKDHPTMKPVALIAKCLDNSTNPGDLVVDPFGGSGSTLVAAEAAGRRAALIELSPNYCDVIVRRWEGLTGQQAKRP